ncbi:hypothetical protein [Aureimonas altamirensis]|uniref:hypothetical protein n=1 Tax=Aureimonas altamirensis TaxID=370622 RepID=UPI003159ADDC
MRGWTKSADLPVGCTPHGLRKTLGRILAESDASTRQIMDVLSMKTLSMPNCICGKLPK